MKFSEFQAKDVVNISDGKRLGHIGDLDIDLETGKIDAIILGSYGKAFAFFNRNEEIVISWSDIIKIGKDVVFVRYHESHSP